MADKIGARKSGSFRAVSTAPSINKTPIGATTPPVPYPVFQDLSSSIGVSPTVNFNGDPAYLLNQSTQPMCTGDAPGTAGGIKSGTVGSEVKPTGASSTVNACGEPVVRERDSCTLNSGNCPGIYVTQPAPGGSLSAGQPTTNDPPVKPETPREAQAAQQGKGFWHQVGGFFEGAYDAGKDMVVGLGQMVAHPIDTATGLYNAGFSGIAKGVVQPYQQAWAAGEYGQALGRGVVDIGSLLIPGGGEAGKVGEAGKIGEVAELGAAAKAGDLAKAGEVEAALAKTEGLIAKGEGTAVGSQGAVSASEQAVMKTDGEVAETARSARGASATEATGKDGVKIKGQSLREKYLGRTPGKNSRTGQEVQEQMRAEGRLRADDAGGIEFQASNKKWYPLDEADMSHKVDAVKWWNETGRQYGPKSPEVRDWMLDSNNYSLDHFSINRSAGAKLPDTYLPPLR